MCSDTQRDILFKQAHFVTYLSYLPVGFFNNIGIHIEQISFSILSKPERDFTFLGRGNGILANHEVAAVASFIDQILG